MFTNKTGLTLFLEKMKFDHISTGINNGYFSKLVEKSEGIVMYHGSHLPIVELYS